jgi:hypothetical protein
MLRAIKQIKESDLTPESAVSALPISLISSDREYDPILDGMAKLTLAVLPFSLDLAMLGLGETVSAANISKVDTGEGRTGFDVSIFKELAPRNETEVRQEAESFKDPFRRLVSLAVIYHGR